FPTRRSSDLVRFAIIEQAIFRSDQRSQHLLRHACAEQDRERLDVLRASDAHSCRAARDREPSVVVYDDPTAVQADLLSSVPSAQQRHALPGQDIVLDLRAAGVDDVAGLLTSETQGITD